jgi:pimeloyl-ACP methyl ester carboxylesterase
MTGLAAGCRQHADPARRNGIATSSDGASIAYAVEGNGPVVVLVHCWCGNRTFYDELKADLVADYRLVVVDLAGHGESSAERADYTMDAFARDVFAVLDQEKIGSVLVVGHSMGGSVALAMAGQQPDRVGGIIGVDTLHKVDWGVSPEQLTAYMTPMREDFPTAVTGFVRSMFPEGVDPATVARATDVMVAASPTVALSAFSNIFSFDLAAAARAYGKSLYLLVDAGRPVDVDSWREHGVEAQVTALEGVGHFPMFTAPDRFHAAVREALTALASR